MNVILIGYRGSGKTSVGKLLADRLWKQFADVDAATCQRFGGMSIADIWAQHGEPAWRERELEATRELIARPDHVIALGGGTLTIPAAREAVKAAPDTKRIYLRCEPDVLHARIHADAATAATRPSLTALGGGIDEVRSVLAAREPIYREVADAEFDVTHTGVQETVEFLIRRFL